jgi:hypothetical protein
LRLVVFATGSNLPHETAVQLHGLLERFERSLLLLSAFVLLIFGFV